MRWLLWLLVVVPITELWLLIQIGGLLGALNTVALVVLTAVVGSALARREGLRVLRQWQQTLASGEPPQEGLTGAALITLGGLLLVVPGVLTDVVGLLLLVPPVRRWVAARLRARLEQAVGVGAVQMSRGFGPSDFYPGGHPREREVQGEVQVRVSDPRAGAGDETDGGSEPSSQAPLLRPPGPRG
ncbi:MAG: FxsA family protein [Myxococcota bacterium]|nr:FxsA family protein [Myxococcota bacterium]